MNRLIISLAIDIYRALHGRRTAPGLPETVWFESGGPGHDTCISIVARLRLGWWDVADMLLDLPSAYY